MKKTILLGGVLCLTFSLGAREAPGQPSLSPGVASLGGDNHMILAGVELALPMFIEAFDTRLARYLEVVGERSLTRVFSDKELYLALVRKLEAERLSAIQEPIIRIHPDGFHGSIKMNFGGITAKLQGRVALKPVNQRLHVELKELFINGQYVSSDLLKVMERETNMILDSQNRLLNVSEFLAREGTVLISVETR